MLLGTGECDLLKGYEIIGQLEPVPLINWPRESQTVARTLSQIPAGPTGSLGLIVSAGLVDWQYTRGEWLPGEERLGPACCTLMLGANVRDIEGEAGIEPLTPPWLLSECCDTVLRMTLRLLLSASSRADLSVSLLFTEKKSTRFSPACIMEELRAS